MLTRTSWPTRATYSRPSAVQRQPCFPVVLDGLVTSVAALLAVRMQPAAHSALVAGQRSRERAHDIVLTELGLEPLLQLRLRAGEGVGACLAAQLLLTGLRTRATTARVSD